MALYDVSTTEKKASPSLVAGGTLYADNPLGTILPFGSAAIPTGWLLCDGTAISRTTYSELFAVIGTAFGSGDGSTTFNLPDMRESVPKGAGLTGKTVGNHLDADGLAVGEFLDDRLQEHNHGVYVDGNANYKIGWQNPTATQTASGVINQNSTTKCSLLQASGMIGSTRSGDTTEVKSVGVNYIIKAKMTAVPSDFLAKVEEVVEFGEFEEISISSSSSTPTTIAKSGMLTITLQTAVATTARVYVNGILVASSTQNGAAEQITTVTIPVTKGDSIYITDRQTATSPCHLRPYNFN